MNELPDRKHGDTKAADAAGHAVPAREPASSSRRRLVIGAALSAPIVSLIAPSAMAGTYSCSYSGMQSATFSSHSTVTCSQGRSPGYWMETPSAWPSGYYAGSPTGKPQGTNCYTSSRSSSSSTTSPTTFEAAFGSRPRSFSNWDKQVGGAITLMNVMREFPGSPEFHWVGALLNAATGNGYPYTQDMIRTLWNDPTLAGPNVTYVDLANFFLSNLET